MTFLGDGAFMARGRGGPGLGINPLDALRYTSPMDSITQDIANYFAQQNAPPSQVTQFYTPQAWAADSPEVRTQKLSYILSNPSEFAGPGRRHASFDRPLFPSNNIPGITAPGAPGTPTGRFVFPTEPTPTTPSSNGGGTTPSSGVPPGSESTGDPSEGTGPGGMGSVGETGTPSAPGEAAGPGTGTTGAGTPGQQTTEAGGGFVTGPNASSFSFGGRAFGENSPLGFLNSNPTGIPGITVGSLLGTAASAIPGLAPGITSPITVPLAVENTLPGLINMAPNVAGAFGLGPMSNQGYSLNPPTGLFHADPNVDVTQNLNVGPMTSPDFRTQRAGERNILPATPARSGGDEPDVTTPDESAAPAAPAPAPADDPHPRVS